MKYVAALISGILVGIGMFLGLMYANPFAVGQTVSPLAVTNQPIINLEYSADETSLIFHTSRGREGARRPESAVELWEPTLRNSRAYVVHLADSRGRPAGVAVKFSTDSEKTHLLNSEIVVDSVWHAYLPERGTLFASQTEDYWSFLRDVVVQAKLDSAGTWRGAWTGVMTSGPNAIGTGRAIGGSGEFAELEGELVESLNAVAYSADAGPVALRGSLAIAWPSAEPEVLSVVTE